MNKEDTINIDQLISKLKQMFDADDAACRALEAFNRGEVPYDEFEINNEVCDMLWRELKENIDTFSKLSCSECKMYDICDKSQRELNQFCSSFTTKYKKIPKSTMDSNANTCKVNKLTASEIRHNFSKTKIDLSVFGNECVNILVLAGFCPEYFEGSWDDVPYLIVNDKTIERCYSPREFRNCTYREVDVSELLTVVIINGTEEYEDDNNNAYTFDIEDIEYIRTQLYDIVEFMKSKHPGKTIVINDDGVSIIPVVMPIYSPTDKNNSSLLVDRTFEHCIKDDTDYANVEVKG